MGEAEATGVPSGEGLGTAGFGRKGGEDYKGIAKVQKGEIRRRAAHVADETTPRVVYLVEHGECLAITGRGNGRWDRRELEMP
jgi:hypothetical protein